MKTSNPISSESAKKSLNEVRALLADKSKAFFSRQEISKILNAIDQYMNGHVHPYIQKLQPDQCDHDLRKENSLELIWVIETLISLSSIITKNFITNIDDELGKICESINCCLNAIEKIGQVDAAHLSQLKRKCQLTIYKINGKLPTRRGESNEDLEHFENQLQELIGNDLETESKKFITMMINNHSCLFCANLALKIILANPKNELTDFVSLPQILHTFGSSASSIKKSNNSDKTLNQFKEIISTQVTPLLLKSKNIDKSYLTCLLNIFAAYKIENDAAIYEIATRLIAMQVIREENLEDIIKNNISFSNDVVKKRLLAHINMAKPLTLPRRTNESPQQWIAKNESFLKTETEKNSNIFAPFYYAYTLGQRKESRKTIILQIEKALKNGVEIAADRLDEMQHRTSRILFLLFDAAINDPTNVFIDAKIQKFSQLVCLEKKQSSDLSERFFIAYVQKNKNALLQIRKKDLKLYTSLKEGISKLKNKPYYDGFLSNDPQKPVQCWKAFSSKIASLISDNDIKVSLNNATLIWEILADVCELQAKCESVIFNNDSYPLLDVMIKELTAGNKQPSEKLQQMFSMLENKNKIFSETIESLNTKCIQMKEEFNSCKTSDDLNPFAKKTANNITKTIKKLELKIKTFREAAKKENIMQDILKAQSYNHEIDQFGLCDVQLLQDMQTYAKQISDLTEQMNLLKNDIQYFHRETYRYLWGKNKNGTQYYYESENEIRALNTDLRKLSDLVSALQKDFKSISNEKTFIEFKQRLQAISTAIDNFHQNVHLQTLIGKFENAKKEVELAADVLNAYTNLLTLTAPSAPPMTIDMDTSYPSPPTVLPSAPPMSVDMSTSSYLIPEKVTEQNSKQTIATSSFSVYGNKKTQQPQTQLTHSNDMYPKLDLLK